MTRIAAIIGIVAALVVGFVLLGNSRSAEGPGQAGAVTSSGPKAGGAPGAPKGPMAVPVVAAAAIRKDMRQVLKVDGSLKTDDEVQIGTRLPGKIVEVNAKEGDSVQRGRVLVRLDDRELRAQLSRARGVLASNQAKLSLANNQATWKDRAAKSDYERAVLNRDQSKTRLQQAETNSRLVAFDLKKKVETAEAGVRVARERLSITRDLTRKQELRSAQLAVDQAQAQLSQARVDADNARQMFERRQTLYKQDAIAKEEVDEAERRFKGMQSNVRVAEAAVATAQEKVELAKEGSRPEEVRIAEGQLASAERALEVAKSEENRAEIAQQDVTNAKAALDQAEAAVRSAQAGLVQSHMSQDEIESARAAVTQASADIQLYQTQLSDLVIKAPVSGVVSTRQVNVGEMVTTSTPLMTLVALESVYLEAQVPELEVALLRPGAPAVVTVDALGSRRLGGSVREVIPVADRNSKAFRVRIAVLKGGVRLPVGAYARAAVDVGNHPGAIVVRKDALHSESGDKFVWLIAEDGKGGFTAKRQPVEVGLVDDTYAEILKGLTPGQQVITAGSPAIIEGTPVSVSK